MDKKMKVFCLKKEANYFEFIPFFKEFNVLIRYSFCALSVELKEDNVLNGYSLYALSVELKEDAREKDGELYCLRCHDKMGIPICGACRRPIEERVIHAMGKTWHVEVCPGNCLVFFLVDIFVVILSKSAESRPDLLSRCSLGDEKNKQTPKPWATFFSNIYGPVFHTHLKCSFSKECKS